MEYKKHVIYAIIAVVALWALTFFLFFYTESSDRDAFGNMFGSVNALFSGLAFAGIIITILLQSQELKLQREELKATREEFQQQNATMKFQRFENTFFNLLNLLQKIVDSIDDNKQVKKNKSIGGDFVPIAQQGYDIVVLKGRDVFKEKYYELISKIKYNRDKDLNTLYTEYYDQVKTDFGHYFRTVYRIIKLVDETNLEEEEKYKYVSILRAQLSDYELLWLFYNCLCDYGKEKFKPLAEKYSLLKNMFIGEIHDQSLLKQYNESAFER